ncbi:MAG: DUF1700 domain-containing protein [Lachnospiraceae bacterium]|nr:DUF1700 domain-containing protein [Lachnospiraceae bacterium]
MNRLEFMRELEARLADIPESERREALQYYEDYLNDAGEEDEQEAMEELGTPEEIAQHIKAGLNGNEEGEFTENGYESGESTRRPPARQPYVSYGQTQGDDATVDREASKSAAGKMQGNGIGKILLIVLLVILFSPVILPFGAAVLGLILGAAGAVFGVWIGLLAVGIALLFAGLILLVCGFVKLFTLPLGGAVLLGIGLLMLGIGMILTILMLWLVWKLVPPLFRWIVTLCQKPFGKRKEGGR